MGFSILGYLKNFWRVSPILYMIDWKTRERVHLREWIDNIIWNDKDVLDEFMLEHDLYVSNDYDKQAYKIFKWVQKNITYTSDSVQYQTAEHWSTPIETLATRRGDCEDGAILILCLCRIAGIPPERIQLCAGDVVGGGHAWVRYIPTSSLILPVYLDWCYYVDLRTIKGRHHFNDYYVAKEKFDGIVGGNNRYRNLWFVVNDRYTWTWKDLEN